MHMAKPAHIWLANINGNCWLMFEPAITTVKSQVLSWLVFLRKLSILPILLLCVFILKFLFAGGLHKGLLRSLYCDSSIKCPSHILCKNITVRLP